MGFGCRIWYRQDGMRNGGILSTEYQMYYKTLNSVKIPKKHREAFHNLQTHLACRHTKVCAFIKHTICESLVII